MSTMLIRSFAAGVGAAALFFASTAQATLTLTPTTGVLGTTRFETNDNSNFNADDVESLVGTALQLTEVYKQNVGDASDSGSFASSYQTTFSNAANDPEDALVDYISGAVITGTEIYFLVKDGNQNPAQYVFKISALPTTLGTGWNGTEDIVLDGFWPEEGAISHIAIYTGIGRAGQETAPEPATLAIWSLGLVGVGLVARRRRNLLAAK
jgi:hypothetical protein